MLLKRFLARNLEAKAFTTYFGLEDALNNNNNKNIKQKTFFRLGNSSVAKVLFMKS